MPVIYEKRTCSVTVGQMSEVVRLYSSLGWPALQPGDFEGCPTVWRRAMAPIVVLPLGRH